MERVALKTKRLIIRTPKNGDYKDLQKGINDIEVAKWLSGVIFPYSPGTAKKYIKSKIKEWKEKEPKNITLVIELQKTKKVIGSIGIFKMNKQKEARTGSWMGKKYWEKGFMTETKIAINDFVFNRLHFKKLTSDVFMGNKASIATQKKMGYKFEKQLRRKVKCLATGKKHKIKRYTLTRKDWEKRKQILMKKN